MSIFVSASSSSNNNNEEEVVGLNNINRHRNNVTYNTRPVRSSSVPNITQINSKSFPSDSALGLYNTDYILRMKNKSNAGRAFVFHQLGIPVVADITPSNFHIMGGDDCGYLVNSK